MNNTRYIELLSPARNLACGIEAVKHGADAVYIGAPKFGARAAAGNSLDDIAQLVSFAHLYNARVYVTVNVILHDEELQEVQALINKLYQIGVDALIVQDMALKELDLPPIPLHASTQMDNRTSEKVSFLYDAGFHQIVLARELSLAQIADIHKICPDATLEAFVHGALCVSYSGQCYASAACFGRSANRGECAQFCRLSFDMTDADGKTIAKDKYLLSLKDMNRSERLEEMMDAGVSSFKIEGRLKDVSYVKNITAYYRQKIDAILSRRSEYARSSSGHSTYTFTPQADKSFNRGFTTYFLDGREKDIVSPDTPKSIGEYMGTAKATHGNYIVVAGLKPFHNGDGICFFDNNQLKGFRVNRVDENRLFLQGGKIPPIAPHTAIYRNNDQEFEQLISGESATRKINVKIDFHESAAGFSCTITDEDTNYVTIALDMPKEKARSSQQKLITAEMSKMGNTPFETTEVNIDFGEDWFIPASALSKLRRKLVDELVKTRRIRYRQVLEKNTSTNHPYPEQQLSYLGNIMNRKAASFYEHHGVKGIDSAFELQKTHDAGTAIMFCQHCLRYTMGWCPKHQTEKSPYREPYYINLPDKRRFRLDFDCAHCQMKIITT